MYRGKHYGFMTFRRPSKVTPPTYDILFTTEDLVELGHKLENYIVSWLSQGDRKQVLVYSVEDMNPRMISHELVTCLQYPHVEIKVRQTKKSLCSFIGDREFGHKIKSFMPTLAGFQAWYEWMRQLDLQTIKDVWMEQFHSKPRYRFHRRRKMLKMLSRRCLDEGNLLWLTIDQ